MLEGRVFGSLEVNQPSRLIHPNLRTGRTLHQHHKDGRNMNGAMMKAEVREESQLHGVIFSLNLSDLLVQQQFEQQFNGSYTNFNGWDRFLNSFQFTDETKTWRAPSAGGEQSAWFSCTTVSELCSVFSCKCWIHSARFSTFISHDMKDRSANLDDCGFQIMETEPQHVKLAASPEKSSNHASYSLTGPTLHPNSNVFRTCCCGLFWEKGHQRKIGKKVVAIAEFTEMRLQFGTSHVHRHKVFTFAPWLANTSHSPLVNDTSSLTKHLKSSDERGQRSWLGHLPPTSRHFKMSNTTWQKMSFLV